MTSAKCGRSSIASGIAVVFAIVGMSTITNGQSSHDSYQQMPAGLQRHEKTSSDDQPKANQRQNSTSLMTTEATNSLTQPGSGLVRTPAGVDKSASAPRKPPISCTRTIHADVVALRQPFFLNRLGAAIPQGVIFALRRDVDFTGSLPQLKSYKRARPIVLRANVGDCLEIKFENTLRQYAGPTPSTPEISLHVQGLHWANGPQDDGSFVGNNSSSLANAPAQSSPHTQTYTLHAEREGTFLLYTMGDTDTQGQELTLGLFGAVDIQPQGAEWYRSQVSHQDLVDAVDKSKGNNGFTPDNQPILNYDKLNMLDSGNNLIRSDLTAIITGPNHGEFPGTTGVGNPEPDCNAEDNPNLPKAKVDPVFCTNPASPNRKQPYREITVIYHEVGQPAIQPFPVFRGNLADTVNAGADSFAINYGTGGIASEIYANRLRNPASATVGVGPMANCVDCKYEEFFLSAWSVGDPAMVVDKPANWVGPQPPCSPDPVRPDCGIGTPTNDPQSGPKATIAYYPDDPSNVYHSYLDDHVKFRILHGGMGVTHVHHQHAHQWLQSPNSDESSYLDSQMISPGASYTLEMVYNGSGNRNKTVGDSIFHCHFYPHFAAGMWALWRVHDVFEAGTELDSDGRPSKGARALPDGEIAAGTPIPAVVPIPTLPMAPSPSEVYIGATADSNFGNWGGQVCFGKFDPSNCDRKGDKVTKNPGYPFFIPGIAGARAPHPPLDFAPDGKGGSLDGGLPRHITSTGVISVNRHTQFDWSKDLSKMNARQLPEDGTNIEKVAMAYNGLRCHDTFFPNGNPAACTNPKGIGGFIMNGLPRGPQPGAPYADPAVGDDGQAVGKLIKYKAAAIELDVTFNKWGWHFPQQRILTLWNDVKPTFDYNPKYPSKGRAPEPLFFRANTDDIVEYWHTNLVPSYYQVDDFQVRTPTDIIGQHIHLVKFDVTSSDGAANGYNYEDGTFSPEEVRDSIKAINNAGGLLLLNGTMQNLTPQPVPSEILDCSVTPQPKHCKDWMGAQTTIQRWFVDSLLDNSGTDRTMRTVFTHDHFGPSTHQQAGLYAGLVSEPKDSTWTSLDGTVTFGSREDGGPTSFAANIITKPDADSYREFLLEFADFQLGYTQAYPKGGGAVFNPTTGWTLKKSQNAIAPPATPSLISTGVNPAPGTMSMNYTNEPLPLRMQSVLADPSYAFSSTYGVDPKHPNGDPRTPLFRAYENDKVQVRVLVGAHMFIHFFNMHGLSWPFEPSWLNSGYRSSEGMGLSEHFEMLLTMPSTAAESSARACPDGTSTGDCADYFYSPSLDDAGITNGLWGILRAYNPLKGAKGLAPLPNNKNVAPLQAPDLTCPSGAVPKQFNVTAVAAETALPGQLLLYNSRGQGRGNTSNKVQLRNPLGILYVKSEDLDAQGKLKPGIPQEPLILRANAGDCIQVTLTNGIPYDSKIFSYKVNQNNKPGFTLPSPFANPIYGTQNLPGGPLFRTLPVSREVGLHPQLLSFDVTQSNGINVGYNNNNPGDKTDQAIPFGKSRTYRWYAGKISRKSDGTLDFTPVEFGSLNLQPSDAIHQHINGLYGAMIIEPKDASVAVDTTSRASATVTQNGQSFREFVSLFNDDAVIFKQSLTTPSTQAGLVNYGTEPMEYRYNSSGFSPTGDNSCATSFQLVQAEPQTPIFSADTNVPVRFRLLHPQGTGVAVAFSLHGQVWQREPYQAAGTQIGDNILSQYMGSHDGYGSTDHFDLVLHDSGGDSGDYLYTAFVPSKASIGLWGLFRVGNVPTPPNLNLPQCQPATVAPAVAAPSRLQTDPKNLERFRQQPGFEPPQNAPPATGPTGQAPKKAGDSVTKAVESTVSKNP